MTDTEMKPAKTFSLLVCRFSFWDLVTRDMSLLLLLVHNDHITLCNLAVQICSRQGFQVSAVGEFGS